LKDIEARIKTPVARIDPATLALPKELLDKLGHGKTGLAGDASSIGAYGKSRANREVNSEISAHLEAYAPSVKRLAELEVQAQASFWRLKQKFARR
jgi:ATP-dependent RNA helicase DDX1